MRHGLTVEDVARHLECSPSKVSRLETGLRGADRRDVLSLCRLYQVDRALQLQLTSLAEQGKQRRRLPGLFYSEYADMEAGATVIRDFGLSLIPGLLQTAPYAEAVLRVIKRQESDDVINQLLEARMERRAALLSGNLPQFTTVIDESVLHRLVGGRVIMREQLRELVAVASMPNVSLRILPYSAGVLPTSNNKFILLSFEHAVPDVVFVESLTSDQYLDKPEEVEAYREAFALMQHMAADESQSRDIVASAVEALAQDL